MERLIFRVSYLKRKKRDVINKEPLACKSDSHFTSFLGFRTSKGKKGTLIGSK